MTQVAQKNEGSAIPNSNTQTYRGIEIRLSQPGMVAPYFVAGALRRWAKSVAEAQALIDAALDTPRAPGMRVLAADVRITNVMTGHESRRRSEQARGQARRGGKFAPERHAQIEQQQAQAAVAEKTSDSRLQYVMTGDVLASLQANLRLAETMGGNPEAAEKIKPFLRNAAKCVGKSRYVGTLPVTKAIPAPVAHETHSERQVTEQDAPAQGSVWMHPKYGRARIVENSRAAYSGALLVTVRWEGVVPDGGVKPAQASTYPLPDFLDTFGAPERHTQPEQQQALAFVCELCKKAGCDGSLERCSERWR